MFHSFFRPEIIVPLGAFIVAIVAIVSGAVTKMHRCSTQAKLVETMLDKGMSPEEIRRVLSSGKGETVLDGYEGKHGIPLASK